MELGAWAATLNGRGPLGRGHSQGRRAQVGTGSWWMWSSVPGASELPPDRAELARGGVYNGQEVAGRKRLAM